MRSRSWASTTSTASPSTMPSSCARYGLIDIFNCKTGLLRSDLLLVGNSSRPGKGRYGFFESFEPRKLQEGEAVTRWCRFFHSWNGHVVHMGFGTRFRWALLALQCCHQQHGYREVVRWGTLLCTPTAYVIAPIKIMLFLDRAALWCKTPVQIRSKCRTSTRCWLIWRARSIKRRSPHFFYVPLI